MMRKVWRLNNGSYVVLYCADCRKALQSIKASPVTAVVTDPPYGLSFMGKGWDHGIPGKQFWQIIAGVCKPGAPLLSFGGTRTYHRLACAIEDGGWEIRDCLMWLYGTGFPKSHDISKATGSEQWNGWGTALKPAWEPITLAMLPLEGTFADNAKEYGVAGLNVDGCRVSSESNEHFRKGTVDDRSGGVVVGADDRTSEGQGMFAPGSSFVPTNSDQGRWPANVIHDGSDEVVEEFDKQSKFMGMHGAGKKRKKTVKSKYDASSFHAPEERQMNRVGDQGSASRFFYCAKAGKKERWFFCGECQQAFPETERKEHKGHEGVVSHPTVKPLSLMSYLVKLVSSPKKTVILDPFMGTGSTGVAAIQQGFSFIGVESDPKSFIVAAERLYEQIEIKELVDVND